MRKSAPPLLAIFRTQLQGELLARLYLRPWDADASITDLAVELHRPVATVHREATRLVQAGLLTERHSGRSILLGVPQDELVTRPLTELLAVTFGPLPVLRDLLADTPGVQEAYIYGSWAARYHGEPGPVPVDVDVLVVGDADPDDLFDLASTAEKTLGREVNVQRVRLSSWQAGTDPFVATVRSRPLVNLRAPEAPTPAVHA